MTGSYKANRAALVQPVPIRFAAEMLERIDTWGIANGKISRTDAVRSLINTALPKSGGDTCE